VSLDVVAAEGITRAQRRLEVHLGPERLRATLRFSHHVEGETPVVVVRHGETDAVHGN
jgi:hypothetical protein